MVRTAISSVKLLTFTDWLVFKSGFNRFAMNMKKLNCLFVLFFPSLMALGQCPTTFNYATTGSNQTWASESWAAVGGSVTTGGTPPSSYGPKSFTWSYNNQTYSNCIVIPSGVTVEINDNSFYLGSGLTLVVQGNLVVEGKVNIDKNTGIIVDSGGLVCCNTCTGTDRISLGSSPSTVVWGQTSFPPVTGPTTCSGTCTVLPITLIYFEAKTDNSDIQLNWSTASELNFDYFSLQRSIDGTSFNEITQVKGNGTTDEAHNYSYEDKDPIIGRSYYRLTSNDFDGYQQTFKVVSVDYRGEKRFSLSPNPTDGSTVKLNFNFANDANAQVTIYDNMGSVIGVYQVSGSGSINFDNALKSGIYLAKYTSSSFTKTERFLVR
jgi:hypothetical protein